MFLICLLLYSFPSDSQTLSLKECISYALENSATIGTTELQNKSTQAQLAQQKGFMLPEISAYADYWQYLGNFPVYFFPESEGSILSGGTNSGRYPVQLGQRANFMTGIQLNQRLFDARLLNMRSSTESISTFNHLNRQKARETVIYDVSKTYIEIAVLLLEKQIIEANRGRVEGIRVIVNDLVDSGVSPLSDLEELQINDNKLLLALSKVDMGISQKTRFLKFQMGMKDSENLSIIESSSISIPESISENQSSTDMQLIEQSIALNTSRLKAVKATGLPTLDLYLNAQWQQQQPAGELFGQDSDWYNLHIAGVRLNIPIFSGKSSGNQSEITQIENEKLALQLDRVSQSTMMLQSKFLEDYQLAKQEVEIIEQEVQIREAQAGRKLNLYTEGLGNFSDLLESETALQSARLDLNKALLQLEFTKLELLKAHNGLQLLSE